MSISKKRGHSHPLSMVVHLNIWYSEVTLSYKIDGCDWQDFIVADKRAYDDYQYNELLSLLEEVA